MPAQIFTASPLPAAKSWLATCSKIGPEYKYRHQDIVDCSCTILPRHWRRIALQAFIALWRAVSKWGASMANNETGKHQNSIQDNSEKAYEECCPVCDATEINAKLEYIFQGVPHHFCSERCQRRFQAYPHLYVGSPQYKLSIKQQGKTVIKRHKIALDFRLNSALQQQVHKRIANLQGVVDCCIIGRDITVSYDLVRISLKDIEQEAETAGASLRDSLTAKAKRHAIHFGEECELDNLAHLSDSGKQYSF